MHSRHLGSIVSVNLLYCYMYFKWDKLRLIVDTSNFAVVYTPTSIELGEGITAKLASVDFDSSKVRNNQLATSHLVVALRSYGVLIVV